MLLINYLRMHHLLKSLKKHPLQGAQQRALEIARNFLWKGIDAALIAEATGLTVDTVLQLKQSMTH